MAVRCIGIVRQCLGRLIRIAFVVSAFAFLTMFIVALTVSMFAASAFSDFRMSGPSIKVFACCCKTDVYAFTRIEVSRSCWAELYSVRQVDLNPSLFQGSIRGVFHETVE